MTFPSIRIEGAILSPDILDRIEDAPGQKPADFGLDPSAKVKDEIARAWADAQDYWRIFQRKVESRQVGNRQVGNRETGNRDSGYLPIAHVPALTTETRQQWIVPLLGLLGYQLEYQPKGAELNGKTYAISHRAVNRARTPVHIVGYRDPAGLDRKPEVRATGGAPSLRMSPHAMVQEYINLHDQLYGIVTNGRLLRLLRDSSRLVKLSYLEFDLDRIFTDGLFADFALLYRLLHATRLPVTSDTAAESLIERYHQDSLDSGARIRDGLSRAVEQAIRDFGNGFLAHPANTALRAAVADGTLTPETCYKHLLNLIYRLLFLMVIEERGLIFPPAATARQREIYRRYYSVQRLRFLAEKRYLADPRRQDHWLALTATFRLFEADGPGAKLGLAPLAGDLFGSDAIGLLSQCLLGNDVLLGCLRSLSLYEHPDNRQLIRVNYAALNVEEFGSVYEGLLEYEPVFVTDGSHVSFDFTQKGEERAATGSHYTPDELVQPLIKHSLDYLIADKLKEAREIANRPLANREVGNRETGKREQKGTRYVDQQLQGTQGLADRDGSQRAGLPGHSTLSQNGNLRHDLATSPGVGIDSGQHRGGLGSAEHGRLHSLPEDLTGQRGGTGNRTAACSASESDGTGVSDTSHRADTGGAEDASRAHSVPASEKGGGDQFTDSGGAASSASDPLAEYPFWYRQLVGSVSPTCLRDYSLLASQALLSLRIADISCGSGHILLAAARRVATELATVRTGEEQPSPTAYRTALRDTIRECIYGVDLNPLAVELCKVALWLEAHNPGQPLNFLDHHIKCGNSIVGFVRRDELDKGVPDEAFKALPGDDKETASQWRKRNKSERKERGQQQLEFSPAVRGQLDAVLKQWHILSALPERTPAEIDAKKARFAELAANRDTWTLKQIAAIPVAQFYTSKTPENDHSLISDAQFRRFWNDGQTPQGQATALAWSTAHQKRFFHWFLEFPEIIEGGGFDCILGNPPYKGGQHLSGLYGHGFCEYARWEYAPTGLSDLVAFFVRRIFTLLKPAGFTAFITTNSIKDGDIRKDGLEQVLAQGGSINMAVRGIKWPGVAKLFVSLVSLHKGRWQGLRSLDHQDVREINAYFEDSEVAKAPVPLVENQARVFQGSIFLGNGFLLSHDEAQCMLNADRRNADVLFPIINGQELNNQPDQSPGRSIINFHDWPISKAQTYAEPFAIVAETVKPVRAKDNMKSRREKWWQFGALASGLYSGIATLPHCFVAAATTKYLNFSALSTNYTFSHALYILTTDRWDHYAIVQSSVHEAWARKYSGSLETRLRYSPSDCFETFAFPADLWHIANPALAALGERYHEHRKSLMLSLWLGLTDIYNLFHARDLSPALVVKVSKKPADEAERGYTGILELRRLHVALDTAVRDAYGWQDLPLGHDFHEIETLPENDRVRYTISPAARKELLKRLLALNHARAAEETAKSLAVKPVKKVRAKRDAAREAVSGSGGEMVVLPNEWRYTLTPDVYAYRMIQQLVRAAGGVAPIRDVARAYAVLSDGTLVKELAADKELAFVATEWAAAARQQVDLEAFMPALKALIDAEFLRWHGKGLDGTLELTDDARELHPVDEDAWIVADSALALLLISGLPDATAIRNPFKAIEWIVTHAA